MIRIPLLFLRSAVELFSDKRLTAYCLIPWAIACVSFVFIIASGFFFYDSLYSFIFGSGDVWYGFIFSILTAVLIIGFSACASLLLAFVIAGFAIEGMIVYAYKKKGVDTEALADSNFVKALLRGLVDDVRRALFLLISFLFLMLFAFFPPLLVVWYLLSAFLAGFELLDLPLQLCNVRFKDRLAYMKQNKLQVLLLGSCYLLLLMIPFVNLLAMPVAYLVGVKEVPIQKIIDSR